MSCSTASSPRRWSRARPVLDIRGGLRQAAPEDAQGAKTSRSRRARTVAEPRAECDTRTGWCLRVHVAEAQVVDAPASSTREVNVPEAAYGVIRIQSTETPAPAVKSEAIGRMYRRWSRRECVAHSGAVDEEDTLDVRPVDAIAVRRAEPVAGDQCVGRRGRYSSWRRGRLRARVEKIAHGAAFSVTPKPTCWKPAVPNVATNSSDAPGPNKASVCGAGSVHRDKPSATVDTPPVAHGMLVQPTGSARRRTRLQPLV